MPVYITIADKRCKYKGPERELRSLCFYSRDLLFPKLHFILEAEEDDCFLKEVIYAFEELIAH